MALPPPEPGASKRLPNPVRLVLVLVLLYGFLVAIQMMGGAIKLMGKGASEGLFQGGLNPFAGLSVGVLATVLVQSSSTTTATIVSLVGSGVLNLQVAVPMIMGANIGTTVTNTIVSIGHVRRGPEFQRAFAAATVHDFFNLLCVAVLLPLELATGLLSGGAVGLTHLLHGEVSGGKVDSPIKAVIKASFEAVLSFLEGAGLEGTPLAIAVLVLGIGLTFFCLVYVTKNMRVLISGRLERALNRSLGRSGIIGIAVGALVTVSVQSSSITTSLLVPLCAAGLLTLENAFPLMLGANIGTTVTALLASLATDRPEGLTIALVHLFFNLGGVLLFYPVPAIRRIPIRFANGLATRAQRNPAWVLGYVLVTFVLIPLGGWLVFRTVGS